MRDSASSISFAPLDAVYEPLPHTSLSAKNVQAFEWRIRELDGITVTRTPYVAAERTRVRPAHNTSRRSSACSTSPTAWGTTSIPRGTSSFRRAFCFLHYALYRLVLQARVGNTYLLHHLPSAYLHPKPTSIHLHLHPHLHLHLHLRTLH